MSYRLLFSCFHQVNTEAGSSLSQSRSTGCLKIHSAERFHHQTAFLKKFVLLVIRAQAISNELQQVTVGTITHFSTHLIQVLWTVEQLAFVHSAEAFPVTLQFTALESGEHAGHLLTSLFAASLRARCGGGSSQMLWPSSSMAAASPLCTSVKVTSLVFPLALHQTQTGLAADETPSMPLQTSSLSVTDLVTLLQVPSSSVATVCLSIPKSALANVQQMFSYLVVCAENENQVLPRR